METRSFDYWEQSEIEQEDRTTLYDREPFETSGNYFEDTSRDIDIATRIYGTNLQEQAHFQMTLITGLNYNTVDVPPPDEPVPETFPLEIDVDPQCPVCQHQDNL